MLFSVITVCYNSEKTIERTIESVLSQTEQDYEYLIIDGGSTDSTMEIVKSYEDKFQGKLSYISEPDKGLYDAMNKGIKKASGEIIGIVNSDDYYEPDTLEKVKASYKGYPYSFLFGLVRSVREGKEVMVYSKHPAFIEEDMIAHPACFITKAIYDKFGGYSLEYPYSADYEFMLRIKDAEEIQYIELYDILTNFSQGGVSTTVVGYRDTMRLLYQYQLISKKHYVMQMIKSYISMKIKGKK